MILDDGGDLTNMVHTKYPHLLAGKYLCLYSIDLLLDPCIDLNRSPNPVFSLLEAFILH
jgi:S-adenosylhomocysteine hydrolase